MTTAVFACLLFGLALLMHWIVWRIRVPRRHTAALLAMFFAVLATGLAAYGCVAPGPMVWLQLIHVGVFFIAMTLAYVVAYSAIEEPSPSMTILAYVAAAQGRGRTRQEIHSILAAMTPIETRLQAMVRDGMLSENGGDYRLSSKGRAWVGVFGGWRRLLGLSKGG